MKNFTQFSQWLAEQPQMKVAEVINAAVQKGLAMNSIIMGLPSNYNSVFQSVYLYHYDDAGNIVDDTSPEAESIANSVLSNAKSQLAGYAKYFKETKCGEVVGSTVKSVREYTDLDFGSLAVSVNKATGEPQAATIKSSIPVTISTKITGGPVRGLLGFIDVVTLGCGYEVIIASRATLTNSNNNFSLSFDGGNLLLTYLGGVVASSPLEVISSDPTSLHLQVKQGNMRMGSTSMTPYSTKNMTFNINGTLFQTTGDGIRGKIDYTSSVGATRLVDNASLTSEVVDGQDLVSVLGNYFLNPETAMSMIP